MRHSVGIVAIVVWTAAIGCESETAPTTPAPTGTAPGKARQTNLAPWPGEPVRVFGAVPKFRLRNQDGAQFGRKELGGKVWIASFMFTRCTQTCPAQTAALVQLQSEFRGHSSASDIHLVCFTVDPEHDTAEVLRDYAQRNGADAARWSFLTGGRESIWNLSEEGFKLPVSEKKNAPSTIIAHSQNFILVDRGSRIRGYYDGLDEGARGQLKRDLEIVLRDPPGPVTVRKTRFAPGARGDQIFEPPEIKDTPWMKERAEAQKRTVERFDVFHEFRFTDLLPVSGITFVNKTVEDAGRYYKGVHYDHGNGVAIADVDADGLHDIYFVNQIGANQLCKNLGDRKFKDITKEAGVGVADRVGVTASFADTDNDGDSDLFVTTVRGGNLLFENDGRGKFKDVSKASGLDYVGHSSSAVFFDYDRDGLLDLFLTNPGAYTTDDVGPGGYYMGFVDGFSGHLKPERAEQSILYRNTGNNRFVDVSARVQLQDMSWTGAATPIDVNDDGWQDLYVVSMQGHDEYYENVEGKRFVKKSREVFPRTSWGAMGVKSFDFDNDGRMDIFVTDMHTDMIDDILSAKRYWYAEKMKMSETFTEDYLATDANHVRGNAFFKNEGSGKFREISEEIGAENYWPWGVSVGDLNADGWEDVFVASSMNFPFRYGVNSIYLNNRGKRFLDSEFILGVEPRRKGRTSIPWFELDCSGADREHVLCKDRSGRVEVWGTLGTRSSVIFDLDGDGDLDIVTNDFNSEPMVLVSNLAQKKPDIRYLLVKLSGTRTNRDGLGARVRVKAGGQTYTKVNDGQSGYLSQSVYPLYFGLAAAAQVDEIEVVWPSTGAQVVAGPIEANQTLTITEK